MYCNGVDKGNSTATSEGQVTRAVKINEVESQVGITKKNIRFYEEQGLLTPRRNSENGYRDYGEAEVQQLRRIKLLRKLGFPLEEIRQMQGVGLTLADGMRRHLVILGREQKNLEQSIVLCQRLSQQDTPLEELDAEALLAYMQTLERDGTTFQNMHSHDRRRNMVAPVAISLTIIVSLLGFAGLFLFGLASDGAAVPPLIIALVLGIPTLAGGMVILVLVQRLREITRGELDEAKKY